MKPYAIRIEEDLLDKLRERAKEEDRSVNAQIRHYIKKGLCT